MTSNAITTLLRLRISDPVIRLLCALFSDLRNVGRRDHVDVSIIKNDEDSEPVIDDTPYVLASASQVTDIFLDPYSTSASPAWFDGDQYLKDYPDVAQSGTPPEVHFLRFGQYETRPFEWRRPSLPAKPDRFQTLLHNHGNRISATERMKAVTGWWEKTSLALSALDAANDGWIGDRKMTEGERLPGGRERHASSTSEALHDAEVAGNRLLVDMYYPREEEKVVDVVSDLLMMTRTVKPEITLVAQAPERQGISIITPYSAHLEFFPECAASVALAIQRALQNWPDMPIEWVIADDDSSSHEDMLLASIPPEIRERCSIFATKGVGPSRATNQAMERAAFGWFVFLDSCDALMPQAIIAIAHYAGHSLCRYLISAVIDIDEYGRILRYRQHIGPASQIPVSGVSASHLKVIHRSAFDLHGQFDPEFDFCQDYEFLLRVLPAEVICLMPDHLYCHRWHDKDRIVRQRAIKAGLALAARKRYVAAGQLRIKPRLQQELGRIGIVLLTQDLQTSRLVGSTVSAFTPDPFGISMSLVVQGTEAECRFVKQAILGLELVAPVSFSNVKPGPGGRSRAVNLGFENAFHQEATAASLILEGDVLLPLHRQWALRLSPLTARAIVGRRLRRAADGTLSEGTRLVPVLQITSVPSIDLAATIISREAYRRVVDRFSIFYPDDMEYYADWMTILRLIHVGTEFEFISDFVVSVLDLSPDQQPCSEQEISCRRRVQAFARTTLRDQPLVFEESVGKFSQALARELDRSEVGAILQTLHALVQ